MRRITSSRKQFAFLFAASFIAVNADAQAPLIECDAAMLDRARARIQSEQQPFFGYWERARPAIGEAKRLVPSPYSGTNPLEFHQAVQSDGIAARLLAYAWRIEEDENAGSKAVEFLDAWASHLPVPGQTFDPAIRFPNAGMDVARGVLPLVAAYDLLSDHPSLTTKKRTRIRTWFRGLVEIVKEGIGRWEANGDFGGQEFQNHHAAHVLGLVILGAALNDDALIQFATDSADNPKDFKELIAGLILMASDEPHGGLRGKPLHPGEIQDRSRRTMARG